MLRVGNTMEVVVSALDPITQLTHVIFSIPWSDVKCICASIHAGIRSFIVYLMSTTPLRGSQSQSIRVRLHNVITLRFTRIYTKVTL